MIKHYLIYFCFMEFLRVFNAVSILGSTIINKVIFSCSALTFCHTTELSTVLCGVLLCSSLSLSLSLPPAGCDRQVQLPSYTASRLNKGSFIYCRIPLRRRQIVNLPEW
ncbi:hypothetical protein XENOCAPTIV_026537 [Xenoophorus captivus]|uniref:Secreted protein n=1 Tax=Xenoophorus captivus TaxID=1517983 RepID=A0ABV0QTN3_9TELE